MSRSDLCGKGLLSDVLERLVQRQFNASPRDRCQRVNRVALRQAHTEWRLEKCGRTSTSSQQFLILVLKACGSRPLRVGNPDDRCPKRSVRDDPPFRINHGDARKAVLGYGCRFIGVDVSRQHYVASVSFEHWFESGCWNAKKWRQCNGLLDGVRNLEVVGNYFLCWDRHRQHRTIAVVDTSTNCGDRDGLAKLLIGVLLILGVSEDLELD